MAQLSKVRIDREVEERIFEILSRTVVNLNRKDLADDFFRDIFTQVERVVVAKRLAVALMLKNGFTYYQIRKILKVSPPTIAQSARIIYHSGRGYGKSIDKVLKDKGASQLIRRINEILDRKKRKTARKK